MTSDGTGPGSTMRAVRLHAAGDPASLALEDVPAPRAGPGEAIVRVHAAAITRDELEWPVDRLPAIPSYELSGTVAGIAPEITSIEVGDQVYGLTGFDRDGAAAELAVVRAVLLAPKPGTLGHVEAASVPLPALSAWQGLFDHGRLVSGQRVLITGAAGGVGHFATQLARHAEAHVVAAVSPGRAELARSLGAHEVLDLSGGGPPLDPVDLIFDTVGGTVLRDAMPYARRVVSVAEEPQDPPEATEAIYFVVEPNRDQLVEITRLIEEGTVRPAVDSVYPLSEARAAFERSMASGKRGKVVLRVIDED